MWEPRVEQGRRNATSKEALRDGAGKTIRRGPGHRIITDCIARHWVFVALDAVGGLLGFYALVLQPPEPGLAFVSETPRTWVSSDPS